MRVLAIHSSNDMYGSDRIFLRVVAALQRAEHDVEVWLPADAPAGTTTLADHVERLGLPVDVVDVPVLRRAYLRPSGLARLARRGWRVRRRISAGGFDAVYLGTSALAPLAVLTRVTTSERVVLHVQELWSGAEGRVLRALGRSAHLCLAISPAVAASVGATLQRRTRVVVNAVPDPGLSEPPAPGPGPTFLVASRWNTWKGHDTLLRAWERAPEGARLVVAGGPPPVGTAFDVHAAVAGLPDPSTVIVVGETDDLARLIRAADVVVVPSNAPEPFGLVAIEAFAAGRPVVASDGGGLAEIVTHGHDGLTFPMGDAVALGDRLRQCAETADLRRMGLAARETYERRYSPARFDRDLIAAWGTDGSTTR